MYDTSLVENCIGYSQDVKRSLLRIKSDIDFTCEVVVMGTCPGQRTRLCICTGMNVTSYVNDNHFQRVFSTKRHMEVLQMPYDNPYPSHLNSPPTNHLTHKRFLAFLSMSIPSSRTCKNPHETQPQKTKKKVCSTLFQRKRHGKRPLPQSVYDR